MFLLALVVLPLLTGCLEEAAQSPNPATAPLAAPAETELAALRAEIEALRQELAAQRDAMQQADAALAAQMRAVSDAATSAVAAVDVLLATVAAVSTTTDERFGTVDQHLQQIDGSLVMTGATLAGLRSDVDAQQAAIWTLQSDVAAAQATANDAAALAATWPAAVSAWAEGRYVRRLHSWSMGTTYKPADGLGAGQFFAKQRYSFEQIGLDVTGPVSGRVLLGVQYTYSQVTTDRTAALWVCAGGGEIPEALWDMPLVDPAYGCTVLPNEAVDVSTNPNVKDVQLTMMARLVLAHSFAFQVTGNPAMLRDLPAQPFPVFVVLRPIAWFPDDP